MAEDLIDTVRETIKFLRKATAEMRQIADEGGPETAQRLRHMADQAEQPHVSIRVIPISVVTHPALEGAFVVLEFPEERPVVHIEGRRSGIFPDDLAEVEDYMLAAERSTDLALPEQESKDLLRAIAEDMERAR